MSSTIKTEADINTTKTLYCHGCLCQDRKLKPLSGEIYKLYYSLLGSGMLDGSEERMICWECEATLRRVRRFENQIIQAHTALLELFYNMSPKLDTLSNLSISTKDYYDLHYEYTEQTYTQTDCILKTNENIIPETVSNSDASSDKLIENCPLKIENLKEESESSQHSDNDNDYDEDNFEKSNDSASEDNTIDDNKPKKKIKKKKYVHNPNEDNFEKSNDSASEDNTIDDNKPKKKIKKKKYVCNPNEDNFEKSNDSASEDNTIDDNKPKKKIKNKKYVHDPNEDNFEKSNDSASEDNTIDDNKPKKKMKKKKYVHDPNEDKKAKKKRNTNNNELSKNRSAKYLKYATVKDINPMFETDVLQYFKKEFLILEQIEKYNTKLEQNPCGDRCMECRLDFRADFISILRQNLSDIKPDSTTNCLLCRRKLRSFDKLRSHWKESHLTFHKCTLCGFYCRRERRLNHLNDQHTKVYFCKKCDGEFTRERRLNHLNDQHTKVYFCKKCDGEFTSEYHFKLHFKRLHDTYVCQHCNKVSSNRSMMIKHLALRHEDKRRRRVCKICKKVCTDSRSLKAHINARHPECKKVEEEAAYCVECDKQFRSIALFKVHLAGTVIHNPVRKTYPCPECGKIFKMKSNVENHVHQVHMKEKARFKCTICNKICAHKNSLQRHIADVHLKVPKKKNKFCEICGRGFSTMRILANHRRTHTGEKPFKCAHCPVAFTQKSACLMHMRKQHNDMNRYTLAYFLHESTQ